MSNYLGELGQKCLKRLISFYINQVQIMTRIFPPPWPRSLAVELVKKGVDAEFYDGQTIIARILVLKIPSIKWLPRYGLNW